ncbi:MAG: periplasmic protein TonB [Pseudomonadota bacterium]|nr:periplasmic protein TonB [Pseudomonadota bacterium]
MGEGKRAVSAEAGTYYAPPATPSVAVWRRGVSVMGVVGIHLLLVVALVFAAVQPEIQQPIRALAVRLLEPAAPTPPKVEPPKPLPPQAAPRKTLTPPPILAAAKSADAPASFAVVPQPEPFAAPVVQAPALAPITAARFDADYLQNPKPVYPPMSRRMNEEGKVVLRVRVSAQGQPLAVEIKQSSGYARLDEAAKTAVERWRFVPARQGSEAIEASVLVPLNFTLSN